MKYIRSISVCRHVLLGNMNRLNNSTVHTPFRAHFGMYFKTQLLETSKGRDLGLLTYMLASYLANTYAMYIYSYLDFDRAVHAYYAPYHKFIDSLARCAYNENGLKNAILDFVTLTACESVQSAHLHLFAKLCLEIVDASKTSAQTLIHDLLQTSSRYFLHYIEIILIDERIALHQNDNYLFLRTYLPMIFALKKHSTAAAVATTPVATNNDHVQNSLQYLEQLLMKTYEHCLQSISNESQSNLDWLQSYKKSTPSIHYSKTQIIGDIKALELYLHCQIDHDKTKIQTVIEQSTHLIEQHLQLPLLIDDEQQQHESESTSVIDDESNPMKKRRLDESSVNIDIPSNDPKRKEIMDALQILKTFLINLNNLSNQSMTIEQ
jgi:hypothetical protein